MTDIVAELERLADGYECTYKHAAEEIKRLRAERDALRRKCSRIRKSLRDLNKAHTVLWKVLSLHFEAKRKE